MGHLGHRAAHGRIVRPLDDLFLLRRESDRAAIVLNLDFRSGRALLALRFCWHISETLTWNFLKVLPPACRAAAPLRKDLSSAASRRKSRARRCAGSSNRALWCARHEHRPPA